MLVNLVCEYCGKTLNVDEKTLVDAPYCEKCGARLTDNQIAEATSSLAAPTASLPASTPFDELAPTQIDPRYTPAASKPDSVASDGLDDENEIDDSSTTVYTLPGANSDATVVSGDKTGTSGWDLRSSPLFKDSDEFTQSSPQTELGTHAERILKADPFYRIARAKKEQVESTGKDSSDKGFVYGIHRLIRAHVKGGMGMVHIAYDKFLKREVALKELFKDSTADESIVHRFIVEAEITAQLEHPGIVPIHSLGLDIHGNPYYTMKLIRGKTLQEAIKQYFKEPNEQELKRLIRRFVSVCQTMSFAHKKGVIHRDLKPANIMLSDHGETLVMDWGIAKQFNTELGSGTGTAITVSGTDNLLQALPDVAHVDLTLVGTVVGTPAFMSPEQASPESPDVGPISDIFSLGAIMFYLLTGRNAYTGRNSQEILTKVLTTVPPKPSDVARNIPPGLEAICLKAMARNPQNRYQSAEALVADLCNWLDGEPVSALKETMMEKAWRYFRKHRQVSVGVLLAMFCLFSVITIATIVIDRNVYRAQTSQAESEVVSKRVEEINEQIKELSAQSKESKERSDQYMQEIQKTAAGPVRRGLEAKAEQEQTKASELNAQIVGLLQTQRELEHVKTLMKN